MDAARQFLFAVEAVKIVLNWIQWKIKTNKFIANQKEEENRLEKLVGIATNHTTNKPNPTKWNHRRR